MKRLNIIVANRLVYRIFWCDWFLCINGRTTSRKYWRRRCFHFNIRYISFIVMLFQYHFRFVPFLFDSVILRTLAHAQAWIEVKSFLGQLFIRISWEAFQGWLWIVFPFLKSNRLCSLSLSPGCVYFLVHPELLFRCNDLKRVVTMNQLRSFWHWVIWQSFNCSLNPFR